MTTHNRLAPLTPMPKMSKGPRAKTNDCECGCGGKTGTRFVPGHDSRLRGWAMRLERGIVTEANWPASKGELVAAKAELARQGVKLAPAAGAKSNRQVKRERKMAKAAGVTVTPAVVAEMPTGTAGE